MDYLRSFEGLDAYKSAKELTILIYKLMNSFPREELYALCDQLRRSTVSVTSNIAEGSAYVSPQQKTHFLEISFGSLMEVLSQMDVAHDLQYINDNDFNEVREKVNQTARLISGLKKYFQSTTNNSQKTSYPNQALNPTP